MQMSEAVICQGRRHTSSHHIWFAVMITNIQGILSKFLFPKCTVLRVPLIRIFVSFSSHFRATVTQAGGWLLDSPIVTAKTGWKAVGTGGMTDSMLLEQQLIRQLTLTWSRLPFGGSKAESLRSHVVMTPVTRHFCRPQGTVWVDKHFVQKSQVMAGLEMAKFGPVTGAWEAARLNMADSTRQQTGFNRLGAVATSKVATRSASGVTFIMVMDQWWWLVEEERTVTVLITGLE